MFTDRYTMLVIIIIFNENIASNDCPRQHYYTTACGLNGQRPIPHLKIHVLFVHDRLRGEIASTKIASTCNRW